MSRRRPSAVAHRSSSRSGPSGIRNASTTTNAIRRGRVASGHSRMGERLLTAREPEPALDRAGHKPAPRQAWRPTATANSCRRKSVKDPAGLAVGDAPGCCGAMRTRSAAGRLTNRSGGSRTSASPSTPTGTGCDEVISVSGADHCCQRRPPSSDGAQTAIPSSPPSMRGREPDPTTLPKPVDVVRDQDHRGADVCWVPSGPRQPRSLVASVGWEPRTSGMVSSIVRSFASR